MYCCHSTSSKSTSVKQALYTSAFSCRNICFRQAKRNRRGKYYFITLHSNSKTTINPRNFVLLPLFISSLSHQVIQRHTMSKPELAYWDIRGVSSPSFITSSSLYLLTGSLTLLFAAGPAHPVLAGVHWHRVHRHPVCGQGGGAQLGPVPLARCQVHQRAGISQPTLLHRR